MLCALVLFPGGQSAPYVALCLVLLQHRLHLRIKRPVIQRQPFGQILMYRGFADAEFFGGGANRSPVFYEVKSQLLGPLFQIFTNRAPLPYTFAAGLCIWRGARLYARSAASACGTSFPPQSRRRAVRLVRWANCTTLASLRRPCVNIFHKSA